MTRPDLKPPPSPQRPYRPSKPVRFTDWAAI